MKTVMRQGRAWGALLALVALFVGQIAQGQAVYVPPVSSGTISAAQIGQQESILKKPVVASRCAGVYDSQYTTNSTDNITSATTRWKQVISRDCADLQLVYGNFAYTSNQTQANPVTYASSIEVSGSVFPVTFNGGQHLATVPVNGLVKSDPVPIELHKGDVITTRTFCSVTAIGMQWPGRFGFSVYHQTEMGWAPTADNTLTAGTAWATGNVQNMYPTPPLAILGTPTTNKSGTLVVIGDSVAAGGADGDYSFQNGYNGFIGWLERSAEGRYSVLNLARGSEATADYLNNTTKVCRRQLAAGGTHYLLEHCINDQVSTAVQEENARQAIINTLLARGVPANHIFQTTVWQYCIANETERQAFNAWVKTNPGGVRYVDFAAVLDANAATYGLNNSQIHPNNLGHQAMADVLTPLFNAGWFDN